MPTRTKRKSLLLVTIGAYGFAEADFYQSLQAAKVDTFCDLRGRRGMRGPKYAFANSRRLQAGLVERGIRYLHFPPLAPSPELRDRQKAADEATHTTKRERLELSDDFIAGYEQECLREFDSNRFVEQLGANARVAALFCVERTPTACHRSLVARRLQEDLDLTVHHITPDAEPETRSIPSSLEG